MARDMVPAGGLEAVQFSAFEESSLLSSQYFAEAQSQWEFFRIQLLVQLERYFEAVPRARALLETNTLDELQTAFLKECIQSSPQRIREIADRLSTGPE